MLFKIVFVVLNGKPEFQLNQITALVWKHTSILCSALCTTDIRKHKELIEQYDRATGQYVVTIVEKRAGEFTTFLQTAFLQSCLSDKKTHMEEVNEVCDGVMASLGIFFEVFSWFYCWCFAWRTETDPVTSNKMTTWRYNVAIVISRLPVRLMV